MSRSVARRLAAQTQHAPEGALVKACLQLLSARGWLAWRANAGMQVIPASETAKRRVIRVGEPGIPDVLAVRLAVNGMASYVMGVECKRGEAQPTAVQRAMHAKLRACGVQILVIRDIADLSLALAGPGVRG